MARGDGITTRFSVDISDLKAGLRDAQQQMKQARAEFREVSSSMDSSNRSATDLRNQMQALGRQVESERAVFRNYEQQLERVEQNKRQQSQIATDLRNQLQNLRNQGVSPTSEEYRRLETQLNQAEQEMRQMDGEANRLRMSMTNQQTAINRSEQGMRELANELDRVEQESRQAETATGRLNSTIDAQQRELAELRRAFIESRLANGEASEETQRLGREMDRLSTELNESQRELRESEEAANRLDNSLENVGDETQRTGMLLGAMQTALGNLISQGIQMAIQGLKNFGREIIQTGMNFESSMSRVQALTGFNADQMNLLSDAAREMGRTTAFSATEAMNAIGYMGQAGWSTERILQGLPAVLNMAAASGMDMSQSADILTNVLTGMGYSASEAERVFDVLGATSTNSKARVDRMAETFSGFAPLAASLGFNIYDTSLAMAILADNAIYGSRAATDLNNIFGRMAAPTTQVQGAMDSLGISMTDSTGQMRPMYDIMTDLRSAFSNLSQEQQIQYASTLAGQAGMDGLLAIVNTSEDDFNRLSYAVNNSSGTLEEMAKVMQDNLAGDMAGVRSRIEDLQLSLYDRLQPALRGGVEWLNNLLDVAGFLVENLDTVITVVKGLGAAILAYVAIAHGATIATKAWTAAQKLLNAVKKANVIGLIIALIVGLIVVFKNLWQENEAFREWVINAWENIRNAIGTAVEWISERFAAFLEWVTPAWEAAVSAILTVWDKIYPFIRAGLDLVVARFEMAWGLIQSVFEIVMGLLTGNWDRVVEGFNKGVEAVRGYFDAAWAFISKIWGPVFEWFNNTVIQPVRDFFYTLWENITTAASNAWDGIVSVWNTVAGWFNDNVIQPIVRFFTPLVEFFTTLFTEIWKFIESVWNVIVELARGTWKLIQAIWEVVVDWYRRTVIDPMRKLFETVWKSIRTFAENAWNAIRNAWNVVSDWFNTNLIQPLTRFFTTLWDFIRTVAINAWNGIRNAWDVVSNWFDTNIIQPLTRFFTTLWNFIRTAASNAWDGIVSAWRAASDWFDRTIISPISNFFSTMWTNLRNGARDAWEGVRNIFSNTAQFFRDIFHDAWDGVRRVFSTGGMIFQNITNGIADAFRNTVNSIIRGINNVVAVPFNAINTALNAIRRVTIVGIQPFSGLPTIHVPRIPELYQGGILKRGQVGLLEGNGAEAVVPLDRNRFWISKVAQEFSSQLGGARGSSFNLGDDLIGQAIASQISRLSSDMTRAIRDLDRRVLWNRDYLTEMKQGYFPTAFGRIRDNASAIAQLSSVVSTLSDGFRRAETYIAQLRNQVTSLMANVAAQQAQAQTFSAFGHVSPAEYAAAMSEAPVFKAMVDEIQAMRRENRDLKVVLNTGALVGSIKNDMDEALNQNYNLTRRGVAW